MMDEKQYRLCLEFVANLQGLRIEFIGQNFCWYRNGTYILHRDDGPAVIHGDSYKAWYQNGVKVSPLNVI